VGGVVRDLLLKRPIFDLDLVVEGDAVELARSIVQERGGKLVRHSRFGTAKVYLQGISVDLATARGETYAHPGALPKVRPGTIAEDLLRRDFTVNAMAVRLDSEHFGEILDPCGGREDLTRRCVRVLHGGSFIDDATRMLRALRYEQRLGFQLDSATEGLLRRDLSMLEGISGDRIRHELELIFREEEPEKALRRADELGLLGQVWPSLRAEGWLEEKLQYARSVLRPIPLAVSFSLLAYNLTPAQGSGFVQRLNLTKAVALGVADTLRLRQNLSALTEGALRSSEICKLLERYNTKAIMACRVAVEAPLVAERLQLYLDRLRYVKPLLGGGALKDMGVAPGRRVGEFMRDLRWAKMDQQVGTRKDEEALVLSWLSEGRGG
jgi:tRNA nucleotidyltransferase (CCA-adding enzyme)